MTDFDLDLEPFGERNERLAAENPRQTELESVLSHLEEPRGDLEPILEALRLLTSDAILDHDDYSLHLVVDGLHRLLAVWAGADSSDASVWRNFGELRGLHNVASIVLERIVPLALLAELEPDALPHRMLVAVAEERGRSNDALMQELETDKAQLSRAGRRLMEGGLVRKRRAGRRNAWEVTPRGLEALGSLKQGGRARPRRRQGTSA